MLARIIEIIKVLIALRGFYNDARKLYHSLEQAYYALSKKKLTSKRKRGIFKQWARAEYMKRTGKAAPRGFATKALERVWDEDNPFKLPKNPTLEQLEHKKIDRLSQNEVSIDWPIMRKGKSR